MDHRKAVFPFAPLPAGPKFGLSLSFQCGSAIMAQSRPLTPRIIVGLASLLLPLVR
jgi:hypothetical protein